MFDTEQAIGLIRDRPWHHDFEIIPGVRTNGSYRPEELWNALRLPDDLRGLDVADVGASNGYFSFEARRRNARVVAFDYRHKDNSGFGLAQHINGMDDIEHHHINVLDVGREDFGQFDIVLMLGLLYHTSDPYLALANGAALSRDRLLVESYCIDSQLPESLRTEPIMRFISDPRRVSVEQSINNDPSNFWGFTAVCLQRMVEDLGFEPSRTEINNDRVLLDCERVADTEEEARLRIAYGVCPRTPVGDDRRDPDAWTVF